MLNWLRRRSSSSEQGSVTALGELRARIIPNAPVHLPAKDVGERRTRADELDAICAARGCSYEIRFPGEGVIQVALRFPDGNVIVGTGEHVAAALFDLKGRLQ